jgi:hypothetical protein
MVLFLMRRDLPQEEGSKFYAIPAARGFIDLGQSVSAWWPASRDHQPDAIVEILTLPRLIKTA